MKMTETDVDVVELSSSVQLIADVKDLYSAFTDDSNTPTEDQLLELAETRFDFRAGNAREDTHWTDGEEITLKQKQHILEIAHKMKMLETSFPTKPFDSIVILGAHLSSLSLRVEHAAHIQEYYANEPGHFIVLSCYRPVHPLEGVEDPNVTDETELAISLLEDNLHLQFEPVTATGWEDLPAKREEDLFTEQEPYNVAVAFTGKIGNHHASVISGSVPQNATRATTASTLESLKTFLEDTNLRLLFVTTSLHLPYQKIQIERAMQGLESEIVGVNYDSLKDISIDSPDSQFRIILQEIGATIKNQLTKT